jgi:hypothetical protein
MAKYRNQKSYSNYPASQNHPNYPKTAYCDDVYAFACLDFVRDQAKEYNRSGKPFFGLFAAQIPHGPFAEVEKLPMWDQDYQDKPFFSELSPQSRQWCAMVTRIDAHFGNILNALEDPNEDGDKSDSVVQNTLVVFQSDNGGPGGKNREELNANGGLLGSKGSIYEGGIRVPTIMRWPKKITQKSKLKKGTSTDLVMDCSDLLPTFCELAGAPIPLGVSGVSLAPTLTGSGEQKVRDFLIHETNGQASIISGRYKFIRPKQIPDDSGKKKRPLKVKDGKNPNLFHLYDLQADLGESTNLATKNPKLVEQLNHLITAERVDEPAGFANTYHHWKGRSPNGALDSASNWTEYIYENAGETYMHESGPPKSHWCARISQNHSALAGKNARFLALEVAGSLTVEKGVKVAAHNELRVSDGGQVVLNGGLLESARWVDIQAGGSLEGHGLIRAELFTKGNLSLSGKKPLVIDGNAYLSGELKLSSFPSPKMDKSLTVIKANLISGGFKNNEVLIGGKLFSIFYTPTSVTVKAKL